MIKNKKDKIGVIHGRFQGLHNGHIEYLLAGKKLCEHLIIGITNYIFNTENRQIDEIDKHRMNKSSNPFTYYERMEMIRLAMIENKISRSEFVIVPFPIEQPNMIFNFAPKNAVYYMTIYDEWGKEKYKILKNLKLNVKVMWYRSEAEKPISGSLVRQKIADKENWEQLVPISVAEYIKSHNLDGRIQTYNQSSQKI